MILNAITEKLALPTLIDLSSDLLDRPMDDADLPPRDFIIFDVMRPSAKILLNSS